MARLGFRPLALCLAIVGLLAAAAPAQADPIIQAGDTVTFSDGPGTTGGGEFIISVNGGEYEFISFCLQRTEYMNFNDEFIVDGVTDSAVTEPDSRGGTNGKDPISSETAWLFTQFTKGTLAGYAHNNTQANLLQRAIWMLEGEMAEDASNVYYLAAKAAVEGGWSGIGNVRVLNLKTLDGEDAQDQLVLIPVPEPGTLTLFGTGLAFAALFRRRQRRV